jgi:predicted GH43/DUF377 family glycosyl hydrolase
MIPIPIRRHPEVELQPDSTRVIVRPFIPDSATRITAVIGRALSLSEEEVHDELERVLTDFSSRHYDLTVALMQNFARVQAHIFTQRALSPERQLLIGALFSGEYSLESAALFNPSMVEHPDQSGMAPGSLRFIMSLRATGEGHISSIEFRDGIIAADGSITLAPVSRYVSMPGVATNPTYHKIRFLHKLHEMGFDNDFASAVIGPLADRFSLSDLSNSIALCRSGGLPVNPDFQQTRTLDCIRWLADSNYELNFSPRLAMSERIIFPVSPAESNGIEDARFVKFVDDDGTGTYYATYTAYNGRAILPQFLETSDFLNFRVLTLNGNAVQNKGMALFPRKVKGRYVMLSRQDDENLLIMFSDHLHHWNDPQVLMRPAAAWESVKVGNCGSPIETPEGWLVITHGVGPMRKYCIGAALLDLDDPTQLLGRLDLPLLSPDEPGREGYVPNVVYSCGAMLHGGNLILPFAMSDKVASVATIALTDILAALTSR